MGGWETRKQYFEAPPHHAGGVQRQAGDDGAEQLCHHRSDVSANMKVLLLPKYGDRAASARYRILQYLPYLREQRIEHTLSPLFDNAYLDHKFRTGRAGLRLTWGALLRRMRVLSDARRYDGLVVHCEAFPYLPAEALLRRSGRPYVLDMDDAIFHTYDVHSSAWVRWWLRNKIPALMAGAREILAGSEYIAKYARKYNRRVTLLPTVVDTSLYDEPNRARTAKPFTIGWIGSPSTSSYLDPLLPRLEAFCAKYDGRVILIGAATGSTESKYIQRRKWSEATEIADLFECDVGIMPLRDDSWSRGKCGFKLIQYMACRRPVIASPVGENMTIVEHGVNGFLATAPDEWEKALAELAGNPQLRERMGLAGRRTVERTYALKVTAPTFVRAVQGLKDPFAA